MHGSSVIDEREFMASVDARHRAELALVERLRRAPHCWLDVCPRRSPVELCVAGISVSAENGIAVTLREWARQATERVGR